MPILLLIRHATSTGNARKRLMGRTPGIALTDEGLGQATDLARRLEGLRLTALYSSPLERCLQTATPLADSKGLPITRSDELLEVDYGDWTGRSLAQLARTKMWRTVMVSPSTARFPGGETLLDVQDRAVRECARIASSHAKGTVAIVSHGDVIRLLLAHFCGVHVDLFQRIVVDPASVSAVALGARGVHVLRMNDTGTVEGLRG